MEEDLMKEDSMKDPTLKQTQLPARLPGTIDMFAYSPIMTNIPTVSSCVGVSFSLLSAMILLLYITMTSMDFVTQQPQLVQVGSSYLPLQPDQYVQKIPHVGIEVSYRKKDTLSGNWTYVKLDSSNTDPYFRYQFSAKQIKDQDRLPRNRINYEGRNCHFRDSIQSDVICPHESLHSNQKLQGTYNNHEIFQYFEIELTKCTGGLLGGCASLEDIDESIQHGDVSLVLHVQEEDFDPIKFHTDNNHGTQGETTKVQSWRFFVEPNREQLTEVIMEGRRIIGEQTVWGFMQNRNINILSFQRKETTYRYNRGEELMNFYFQLHNQFRQEEIRYRRNSILDMIASWGAMAAFLTIFSFGQLARLYNKRKYNSFMHKMKKTAATDVNTQKTKSISQILEKHFFSDPRLLLQEDFDDNGCLSLSTEELHFPTKPIGQLRQIALLEHVRKHQAATAIGTWYRTHRGQIRNKSESNDQFSTNQRRKSKYSPRHLNRNAIVTSVSSYRQRFTTRSSCMYSPTGAIIATVDSESKSEMSSLKGKDAQSISSSTIGGLSQVTPRNFNSIKEGLVDMSIQQIKKAVHNMNLKPLTEVSDAVTQVTALTLFQDFIPISHSSRSIRWKIPGKKMIQWLGLKNYIHPVNFEGKVITLPGQKPSVYSWASIETCDIKYDKSTSVLTLRFQTFLSGTGIPDENGNPQFTY